MYVCSVNFYNSVATDKSDIHCQQFIGLVTGFLGSDIHECLGHL